MPSRRVLGFTALAFLAGAILSAALLFEGSPLGLPSFLPGSAAEVPVLVHVTNIGTHDANITVDVSQVEGSASGMKAYLLAAGGSRSDDYAQGRGQFVAALTAQWAGGATSSGRGTARVPGTTEGCRGSQSLVFQIDVDTTRGVSFTRLEARCL